MDPYRNPSVVNTHDQLDSRNPVHSRVYDGFRPEDRASVATQSIKVFDAERAEGRYNKPSCWSRFKVLIWGTLVLALIAAVISLSVIMVKTDPENGTVATSDAPGASPGAPPGALPDEIVKPGTNDLPGASQATMTPELAKEIETKASDKDGTLEIMKNPPFAAPAGWTPLWWDEFDGDALNLRWWNYQYGYGEAEGLWQWGNREEQFYTDKESNVRVSDGTLKITAIREPTVLPDGYTFEYTSGRINTQGKAAFYGGMTTADGRTWNTIKIEASLKAPQPTVGTWAAYWMLPIDQRYGAWATSGEIDIYEMKNEFKKNNMALHYGGPSPKYDVKFNEYENKPGGGSFSSEFTVVTLEWSPGKIEMFMDGVKSFSLSSSILQQDGWYSKTLNGGPNSPFDMPFYIILNLAIGGKYPGDATEDTLSPNTFEIDYIRVFGK